MSILSEITRLENAKAAIAAAIAEKGVTVPDGTLLDGMAALIDSIEAGGMNLFGSHFESGSITPVADITTNYEIHFEQNMSQGLNSPPYYLFVLWCRNPVNLSLATPNSSWEWLITGRRKRNGTFSYGQYLSTSGNISNASYQGAVGNDDQLKFTLFCTTSKKLVAGRTYDWIVIKNPKE